MTKPPSPEAFFAAERARKVPVCLLCVAECREDLERARSTGVSFASLGRWAKEFTSDRLSEYAIERHFNDSHHERNAHS